MTSEYGRELLQFPEIIQPLCARRYGDAFESPTGGCTAQLGTTGNRKCYNTRATCQDAENYSPTDSVVIRFSRPQNALLPYGPLIPSLEDVEVTPGRVNLGGMDRNSGGLGQREVVKVTIEDHQDGDQLTDPYRLERPTGEASLVHSGDVPSTGSPPPTYSDTLKLAAEASTTGDAYNGMLLSITAGAGSDQSRTILDYDGVMQIAILEERWGTNLLIRSQELDHAAWDISNEMSVSANERYAPDGTLSVERLTATGSSDPHRGQTVDTGSAIAGKTFTFSVWLWTDQGQPMTVPAGLYMYDAAAGDVKNTPITVSTSPQRFNLTGTFGAVAGNSVKVRVDLPEQSGTYWYAWGAQLEESSAIGEYIQTSAAPVLEPDDSSSYEIRDAFDPESRGTFWGKFLARNPYHQNYTLLLREGYQGQALDDMRVRTYLVDKIDGPTNGQVVVTAKDIFVTIDRQKAVAPHASLGELAADYIGSPDGTFTVTPAGIGNVAVEEGGYADITTTSAGYVAINSEILRVKRSGDTFTVLERAAGGTEQDDHEEEDLVQICVAFTSMLAVNISYELLCGYTALGDEGSPTGSSYIDKAAWDAAASELTELYTTIIAEPTPVQDLLAELAEQAGFTLIPNVLTGMIDFRPLRASVSQATITDNEWVIEDSLTLKRKPDRRMSQFWIYYSQKDRTKSLDERSNYRSRLATVDLASEGDDQYGTASIREIFSRWIPQFGRALAVSTGDRLIGMFRDPPVEASFELHDARSDSLSLASYVDLETADIQDDTGAVDTVQHAVIEMGIVEERVSVVTQSVQFPESVSEEQPPIHIDENGLLNLNLRTIYDSIYGTPEGGSPTQFVYFVIDSGVIVGSSSNASPALRTGSWPTGVELHLTITGRVQGKGGDGGEGGGFTGDGIADPGEDGGTALLVEHNLTLSGTGGIFGGGGGGGGGEFPLAANSGGGGGGGGGAGMSIGEGAALGAGWPPGTNGTVGADGTSEAGGAGGQGGSGLNPGGDGGDGGGPGESGDSGQNVAGGVGPGAGGDAGTAIDGASLVTFTSPDELDIRGAQVG